MKIRNGFVSNSSSSSFIIVGVNTTLLKSDIETDKISTMFISEEGSVEKVTGYVFADTEDYLEDGDMSIGRLNEMSEELSRKLKVDKTHIKLYYGTRPS